MIALTFADHKELKKDGRNFSCSKCPEEVQKLRRCEEDRWDFTKEDNGSVFPIGITKTGPFFSFCPGKATWDHELAETYKILEISFHTGQLPYVGGLLDQPSWFIELLHVFVTVYDDYRFYTRQSKIWGGGGKSKKTGDQSNSRAKARKIGRTK